MINIKLLFIILDYGNNKKIRYILNRYGIKVKTVSNAKGTATPSVLSYFGLTQTKKEMYMAIIPDYLSIKIVDKLKSYFKLNNVGTGITFTIPISSSNKYLSDMYKKDNIDRSDKKMSKENNIKHHLIITIVAEGYLEQVMTAAKRVGCSGGTVIKGRGLNNLRHVKTLGFNIEPEKDIVLNIVTEEEKTKVMEEITKEVGIKTKAMGVCFSLPVDDISGIDKINK